MLLVYTAYVIEKFQGIVRNRTIFFQPFYIDPWTHLCSFHAAEEALKACNQNNLLIPHSMTLQTLSKTPWNLTIDIWWTQASVEGICPGFQTQGGSLTYILCCPQIMDFLGFTSECATCRPMHWQDRASPFIACWQR